MTKKIDGFHLKVIAIISMLINHCGIYFGWSHSPRFIWLFAIAETVGKITFPVMAYLLVEGFQYTRNVKKYALRLAMFWLISIYPFYLLHHPTAAFSWIDIPNNIFFTLLMGLLMLVMYSKTQQTTVRWLIVIAFSLLTAMSDWNMIGVVMIWAFYYRHNQKGIKNTLSTFLVVFTIIDILQIILKGSTLFNIVEIFVSILGFLSAMILLCLYNGERGYSPRWVKWGFYWFYPIHLAVIEIIGYFIN